jgi:hypothetical protein
MIRIALKVVAGLALLWLLAAGAFYGAMRLPPAQFCEVAARVPPMVMMAVLPFRAMWMHARAGSLEVGDMAPDFTLPRQDKTGSVQLSAFRGKPVVLIFGSYT